MEPTPAIVVDPPSTILHHVPAKHVRADDKQVGGHDGRSALVFRGSKLLKPVDPRTHELAFYESVAAGRVPAVSRGSLAPGFSGVETIQTEMWGPVDYLVLDNATHGFRHPSILDLKMGTQTWDSDCSPDKRSGHIKRDAETTTVTYGFRFCGMRVWDVTTSQARKYPKDYAWDAKTDDAMTGALAAFLHDGARVRRDLVPALLRRIDEVRRFIEEGTWRFYAASLLMVYDVEGGHEPVVKLIDFAHAWEIEPGGQRDEGFLTGIASVCRFLQLIERQQ
eukprot:m51a1_g3479 putative inositol polyphosphate (279) ;mRNA; f:768078-769010